MGFFTDSNEQKDNNVENFIKLDANKEIDVNSNEITSVLIIIAVLLLILVVMKVLSAIRKFTKQQTQQEQLLMRTLNANNNAQRQV